MNLEKSAIVIWDDFHVSVSNYPKGLEKELTGDFKYLEHTPFHVDENGKRIPAKTTVKKYRQKLFEKEGITLSTYPGFKDLIVKFCKLKGYTVTIVDQRCKFPIPDYAAAFKGLRQYQIPVVYEALSKMKSGCIGVPTRYGKSYIMAAICRAFPTLKTVIAAPGINLLQQLIDKDLKPSLPGRDIVGIFTGSKYKTQGPDITVCSLDSIDKVCPETTRLLLVDEAHASVSEGRLPDICKFTRARRYGFGASLSGRFGGEDILIEGCFGEMLSHRTFTDALKEGAVCPIKVYMVKTKFPHFDVVNRNTAYRNLCFMNKDFQKMICKLMSEKIPKDWQTLTFIDNVKQADFLKDNYGEDLVLAIDKKFKAGEREAVFEGMATGKIKRCAATSIYTQGTTFPDLRVMVNFAGGGGSISSIQRPGRLAQIRPEKKCGYVVDFLFDCTTPYSTVKEIPWRKKAWIHLVRDSYKRMESYRNTGYEVEIVDSIDDIFFE